MNTNIPQTQLAVQLIGKDKLILNREKKVSRPGPYQILAAVEAVGLCFSDLKLLKQFDSHPRKSQIKTGIDPVTLDQIPSYVPGNKPAVPGHEAVVRVCAVGDKVENISIGSRYLVQTDYRWLATENSNAAFGYNFEGGLQQYVLMDQRVITSPDGDSFLLPASEKLSASAVALVEPWACVEDAYAVKERTSIRSDSNMLIVTEQTLDSKVLMSFFGRFGKPEKALFISKNDLSGITGESGIAAEFINTDQVLQAVEDSPDAKFDDILYFGSNTAILEKLFTKTAPAGLLNIIQCGRAFSSNVKSQVGRVHYGGIRVIGTVTGDPAEAMEHIPAIAEIRRNERLNIIGAAGPMGLMHVARSICQGVEGLTVYAGDLDQDRLDAMEAVVKPLAEQNNVTCITYTPGSKQVENVDFTYITIMAPVPKLVELSVADAADDGIINIFAGIPANVTADIDMNAYIKKHLYFVGTSGSVLDDMKAVLAKVESGRLDTNISAAAVTSLEGAIDGIRAVENHLIPGKIIVYPFSKDLPLTTLDKLSAVKPEAAAILKDGTWNKDAEDALMQ